MRIKGFANRLSHDCHLDIERGVSTFPAGLHQAIESIYWVGLFVPLHLVVSSWMVAGFSTINVLLALSEEENVPSAVRSGTFA